MKVTKNYLLRGGQKTGTQLGKQIAGNRDLWAGNQINKLAPGIWPKDLAKKAGVNWPSERDSETQEEKETHFESRPQTKQPQGLRQQGGVAVGDVKE